MDFVNLRSCFEIKENSMNLIVLKQFKDRERHICKTFDGGLAGTNIDMREEKKCSYINRQYSLTRDPDPGNLVGS